MTVPSLFFENFFWEKKEKHLAKMANLVIKNVINIYLLSLISSMSLYFNREIQENP